MPNLGLSSWAWFGAAVGCVALGTGSCAWLKDNAKRDRELEVLRKRLVRLERQANDSERALSVASYMARVAGERVEEPRLKLGASATKDSVADAAGEREPEVREEDLSPDVEGSAYDDGYDFDAQERYFKSYFDELEIERRATGDDPGWEAAVRAATEQVLSGDVLVGNSLGELSCGVSLCRVRVTHENEEARSKFSMLYATLLHEEISGATFHGPRGARETTAYLARRGYNLPAPTRRPGE